MNSRDVHRPARVKVGKKARQPFGQHGFSGSGRAHHEHMVAASGGNLEGSASHGMTLHLGKIAVDLGWTRSGLTDRRIRPRLLGTKSRNKLGQGAHPAGIRPDKPGLGKVLCRNHDSASAERIHQRKDSQDGSQRSVQTQLPEKHKAFEGFGVELL
jgi:hypothetical protein